MSSFAVACSGGVDPGTGGESNTDGGTSPSDSGQVITSDSGSMATDAGTNPNPTQDGSTPSPGNNDAGTPPGSFDFREVDGMVVFEAEHYFEQIRDSATTWFAFRTGQPGPDVQCVTNTACTRDNRPECNEHSNCDGDDIDPADASGGTYLEPLPDRRRTDDEANTGGNIGVVNNPEQAPTLRYRVNFQETGRYYVWVHARGQGPAANGLHVGIDGTWPRNDLIDPSSMRLQFRNGWRWSQTRRGGSNHTGVPASNGVSLRDANVWIEVDTAGDHVIEFAMREDGLEFDKVVLTTDAGFEPEGSALPKPWCPRNESRPSKAHSEQ